MVIFKYELKRHRKYILGWAIALALCVFLMTPTYYSFMDVSTGDLYETLGTSDFYKGVGVSMEYLTSPLGIYAFLTSFFMIASVFSGCTSVSPFTPRSARSEPPNICLQSPIPEKRFTGQRRSRFFSA